jgi:hypothetical protein
MNTMLDLFVFYSLQIPELNRILCFNAYTPYSFLVMSFLHYGKRFSANNHSPYSWQSASVCCN